MSTPVPLRQVAQVQTRAAAGIEDGGTGSGVLRDHPADDPCPVAVEERLQAAEVVGDIDPVVGLDIPVVVLDPLRPGGRARLDLDAVRGVLVLMRLSSGSLPMPQSPHWTPLDATT